ncbi:energy-coupling factor transporter transmembrane component T [Companilactobacillus musae]|uniref:energy-coupling factor transporter transmembrane component T n=1 Tax=Companilactobacillus musae TaxID=1903258 RepID=UPI000E6490CB|nr:energy-coupling factor transporter transmembrane component T [Companilactobacillus musae]
MNRMIENFQKNSNSITMFAYLINVILIALLYNNPIISIVGFISLLLIATLTRRDRIKKYLKFSSVIFIVTVLFNLILNQRGTTILLTLPLLKITTESLLNGIILGISFVNLLWSFYLYDALIRVKAIFELLSNFFRSIAIIFILTIKFIPRIIEIYTDTKEVLKFRQVNNEQGLWKKLRQAIDLNEIILNKVVANFMNVSDALILKGYEQRQKKLGKIEFKLYDWSIIGLIVMSVIFNLIMLSLKVGQINFGSANLRISFNRNILLIIVLNCLMILLPWLMGGLNYLWWKYYVSKTTVSDTITAKNYR